MTDPAPLLAFAEDPMASVAIGPDEERIVLDRAVVTFSPGAHFWSTIVTRVRMEEDDVREGVGEVRDLMRARGRSAAAWSLGPSTIPGDLLDQLVGLGFESESEAGSTILVIDEAPRTEPSPFEVRVVSTLEEHVASIEVSIEGFRFPEADADDERRRARATFEEERAGVHTARLLALDDGVPVATGRAWFSPAGIYLGGGATIPSHRRRGAMSALVAAAWERAVDRGTPVLVTHGGAMAAPALEHLGFRARGTVRHVIDRP